MLRRLRRRFDALVSRTRFERDLRDEIRLHVDERTRDLIEQGLTSADAARQARLEFGRVEAYKEQCRDARGFAAFRPLHGLGGDIRLAARRLAATPQFLIFATLSLAVGLAVTTGVYSVLYTLVWRPIGFARPSTVVFVSAPGSVGPLMRQLLSTDDFADLRQAQRAMAAVAASQSLRQPMAAPSGTAFADLEAVNGDYFAVGGIAPRRGRAITAVDDGAAAGVMVISDRAWRAQFHADAAIIGRIVRLGGQPFEVIGIAPPGFDGIERLPLRTVAWIPLSRARSFAPPRTAAVLPPQVTVFGRLVEGRTAAQAAGELAAIAARLDEEKPRRWSSLPGSNGASTTYVSRRQWRARAADDVGNDTESRLALLLLAIVALVLGVACTNLANLMLARGVSRQQEFAVRRALGASRWRLVREIFVEGGLVALAGGITGLLLLTALLRAATVDLPMPRGTLSVIPELNVAALFVAALALGLSMLVFGLEPAIQLTRGGVTADFAGGPAAIGLPRARRQQAFIRWQVAVSVTFFLAAAILAHVIALEARHDTGVDVDRLGIATVHFGVQGWDEPRATKALDGVAAALRGQPGIESVAFTTGAPFGMNMTPSVTFTTPGRPFVDGAKDQEAVALLASPEVFRTFGIPIVRGRPFDARDDGTAPRVLVISESTARKVFGTADAIGRQLLVRVRGQGPGAPAQTNRVCAIVGIARDTDTRDTAHRGDAVLYLPLAQHVAFNAMIVARTSGDPWDATRAIQLAVQRTDADLAIGAASPGRLMLSGQFVAARAAAAFASGLGLLTLIMSMIGLYGIQSHLVARRTREVGVRLAIGATSAQIRRMILSEGCRPVLQGLGLGLLFGVSVRLLLRAKISAGIAAFDPLAFALVPAPLVAAALLACYLPARRASRVDPNEALRHL